MSFGIDAEEGADTLVIKTAEHMTAVRQLDEATLEADAGILLNHLAVYAQQHGLSGLEFAHGIPGTLGGAICMNAGAYGGEMRQVVTEVTALLPEGVRRFTAEEAAFGYRRSAFLDTEAVVLGARLRLTPDDPAAIRRRMDDRARALMEGLLPLVFKSLSKTGLSVAVKARLPVIIEAGLSVAVEARFPVAVDYIRRRR